MLTFLQSLKWFSLAGEKEVALKAMEMHVCVCVCALPLETRPFPCHPNRLLQQEALGNYRDAACSNGVPPHPLFGGILLVKVLRWKAAELYYDVKKDSNQ